MVQATSCKLQAVEALNPFVLSSVEWSDVNFGYGGKTRFHTTWLASRYLRVFQSNPLLVTGSDGQVKVEDTRSGWLDVQFGVPKEKVQDIQTAIDRDLASLDANGGLA